MKKSKCMALLLLCLLCLLSSCGKSPAKVNKKEKALPLGDKMTTGEQALTKGDFSLSVDMETAQVFLKDPTGKVWRSNPENSADDPFAKGIGKTRIESQLSITYLSKDGVVESTNTRSASVMDSDFVWYKYEDTVTCLYHMASEGLTVPLSYTLNDSGLQVTIPVEQIGRAHV